MPRWLLSSCASRGSIDADTLSSTPENAAIYQHRIVPGDTIHVTIWEVDQPKELKAQVKKRRHDRPHVHDRPQGGGLTEAELKEYLTREVSTYYVNPRLTASLAAVVYLIGEVKNPGVYELDKGQTLVSMLAVGRRTDHGPRSFAIPWLSAAITTTIPRLSSRTPQEYFIRVTFRKTSCSRPGTSSMCRPR